MCVTTGRTREADIDAEAGALIAAAAPRARTT